jgi:hypothetical protein
VFNVAQTIGQELTDYDQGHIPALPLDEKFNLLDERTIISAAETPVAAEDQKRQAAFGMGGEKGVGSPRCLPKRLYDQFQPAGVQFVSAEQGAALCHAHGGDVFQGLGYLQNLACSLESFPDLFEVSMHAG